MKYSTVKKMMAITLAFAFLLLPLSAHAEINQSSLIALDTQKVELTQQEISQRFTEIGNKYPVGEYLSDDDAEFVKTYAKKASDPASIGIQSVTTGIFSGNLGNVGLTGYASVNIGVINNSIQGSITVSDSTQTYHASIGSILELRCWGVFGEGGTKIGLVYSKDYSNSAQNANWNKNTFSDTFVAGVAYSTAEVRGLVDGNSFSTTAIVE